MQENKHAPCLDKKCSHCCNPVKVLRRFPEDKIFVDNNGKKIWNKRDEILIPESHIETVKLDAFDCVNYESKTGLCKDYENRPDICRNSSCIHEDSDLTQDEQQKRMAEEKFIVLHSKRK